ncbi:2-succinyl-5-enolpyruvyl-6-hydroxy-3-cyclohexene-1-carboxylic-acid synthase [Priestia koreensis]|uniref:2-succinyl-5-enolpyruvyl-6-hydroxy-3- cyclohexene-1-carboxylic-acid synthase n=1 Tax=Priestia koreensis TaxID=284581 RepID=UPI00301908AA
MTHIDKMTAYIASFIDELASLDVQDVVVSPGSRSTPLAILAADHPALNVHINIDERSAGFFALGIAKAKQKPVVLVCTSGTATANYYPAVVEAFYARVPLIVVTADRPHELRDVGAPQAIDQIRLFGEFAKWFAEVALPEDTPTMLQYIRTVAARAVGTALSGPKGPVHLNVPLREPLLPNLSLDNLWGQGKRVSNHYVTVQKSISTLSDESFKHLATRLASYKKGVIICGGLADSSSANLLTELAKTLGFPVLADPLSQLRSGNHDQTMMVNSYDTFLRNEAILSELKPDVIVRFGAMPVSKALLLFMKQYTPKELIVVDEEGGWRDPTLLATEMISCDEELFCKSVLSHLSSVEASNEWSSKWLAVHEATMRGLQELESEHELSEGKAVLELSKLLPDESTLFVGNSMPIRDVDSFFIENDKHIKILANRGANGIDGVVSTALGTSLVEKNTVLLIGDLSFYHDLNGLLAAKMHNLNITIVLVNNNGGGIFSFLPQSKEEKHFEALFGTPADLEFEKAIEMYGGKYVQADTWEAFREAFSRSVNEQGVSVVEIKTKRHENVLHHRNLWNRVTQEINKSFLGEK